MAEKSKGIEWGSYLLGLITVPVIGIVATTVATIVALVVGQRAIDKQGER